MTEKWDGLRRDFMSDAGTTLCASPSTFDQQAKHPSWYIPNSVVP